MAALDVDLVIHDRLWTLIEADTELVDALGAQLKITDTNRIVRDWAATMPAQYPKITIEMPEGTTGKGSPSVFGQRGGGSSIVDYGVPITRKAVIRLVYDRLELDEQSPIEAMLRRAILAGGRTLGIAWVGNVTEATTRRDQKNSQTRTDATAGQMLRTSYTISLTIEGRPKLSQLTST